MLNQIKKIAKFIAPSFLIRWHHFSQAFLGAVFYGFPSKKIIVIGVTGTNGKSTVIKMLFEILKDKYKVASFSSIESRIGDERWDNNLRMTMPGRFILQRFLRKAVNSNCRYVILEVTSEGIKQYRHKFIDFNIAVFTNLSPEHIESHGSFEKYRLAKTELFKATKGVHVLNMDDDNIQYYNFPTNEKYYYGISRNSEEGKEIRAINCVSDEKGSTFKVRGTSFSLSLLGSFNIYNALAAICVGLSQDINLESCSKSLRRIKNISGRMETVISEPFTVIVDYAFTPNALDKVYSSVRKNFNPKKLICVLGACGGGRDKWKRPVLGKIAQKYCQEIIVTNEDPYDENLEEIIDQVLEGAGSNARKIIDRREAIKESLKIAEKGDIVLITGKGSESSICLKDGKRKSWDDRMVVREEFKKIRK